MATFGQTTPGASTENLWTKDYSYGWIYTAPESGTLTKISIYGSVASGTSNIKGAVYSVVAGVITAKLCESSVVTVSTTVQNWDFDVADIAIVSGTQYAFVIGEGSVDINFIGYRNAAPPNLHYCAGATVPALWTEGGSWESSHTIFATYTPASGGSNVGYVGTGFF